MIKIESERLVLYPVSDREMEAIIAREQDAELKQAYTQMLQLCRAHPQERIWYAVWYLELKDRPGTVVGDLSFKGLSEDGAAELGYGLRPGRCGKGYMTEAVRAICAWALARDGVNRIEAETAPENAASQRVLARAGFRPTGTVGEEGPRFALERERAGACPQGREKDTDGKLYLELRDDQWPFTGTDHDRQIVRAIVVDGEGMFYFVRAMRDDEFGKATLIETSGGGVEPGEALTDAIRRELTEELGAQTEILCELGVVSDYYNLIRRHNINHYYLCRALRFGDRHLTADEAEEFHLSTLRLTYEQAEAEYEARACTPLGRLIARRELPVLRLAKTLLEKTQTEHT